MAGTSTPFSMTKDINGSNGFGIQFAVDNYSATVAQNTDTTLACPLTSTLGGATSQTKNKFLAIFSYQPGASVWVANNATAAVPAGGSFASTTSTLNPSARQVQAGDILHFYTSDTAAAVGVTFYALF
jgi:hypothetical protein